MLNVLLVVEIRSSILFNVTCCNKTTSQSLTSVSFPCSSLLATLLACESEVAGHLKPVLAALVALSRGNGLFQVLVPAEGSIEVDLPSSLRVRSLIWQLLPASSSKNTVELLDVSTCRINACSGLPLYGCWALLLVPVGGRSTLQTLYL